MKSSLKNLLSLIKNNQGVLSISIEYDNIFYCTSTLTFLVKSGFLRGFKLKNSTIEVLLKYYKNSPAILDIIIYKNNYMTYSALCKLKNTYVVLLISTSSGILTQGEAIRLKLGGYVICKLL